MPAPDARNFLGITSAGRMDTWMLTLKHWRNGDPRRVSIRMLTPPRPPDTEQQQQIGARRATFWAIKNFSVPHFGAV